MEYIASISFGKDSLSMLLILMERGCPLDEVVFYDTGKEFQAIYNLRDKIKPILVERGIKLTELKPEFSFDYKMFDMPVCEEENWKCDNCNSLQGGACKNPNSKYFEFRKKPNKYCKLISIKQYDHNGYSWCGGVCRWGTTEKLDTIDQYCKQKYGINGFRQYVGIAVDESIRLEKEREDYKTFPLAEWDMTERDCLECCYSRGYNWNESGVELYSILDRVSCWCCRNKNLKELKAMYQHLPEYWEKLKDIQARLSEPMKQSGSVFELEGRFKAEIEAENAQLKLYI